jgi:hypothetical protein
MNALKYIINQNDEFMIFSPSVQHIHAGNLLNGNYGGEIIGAGFIDFLDGEVYCYGKSVSLNIKSRGDIDSKIIADKFYYTVEG